MHRQQKKKTDDFTKIFKMCASKNTIKRIKTATHRMKNYLQIKYPTTTKNLIQYTKIVFKIEKLENKQLNFLNGKNICINTLPKKIKCLERSPKVGDFCGGAC